MLSAQMVLKIGALTPLPGLKTMMSFVGLDCGPARLPQVALTPAESDSLQRDMANLGFLEWMR